MIQDQEDMTSMISQKEAKTEIEIDIQRGEAEIGKTIKNQGREVIQEGEEGQGEMIQKSQSTKEESTGTVKMKTNRAVCIHPVRAAVLQINTKKMRCKSQRDTDSTWKRRNKGN